MGIKTRKAFREAVTTELQSIALEYEMRQRLKKVAAFKKAALEAKAELIISLVGDNPLEKLKNTLTYDELAHRYNLTKFWWQRRLPYWNQMPKSSSQRGFTLIELVICVAILGIVIALIFQVKNGTYIPGAVTWGRMLFLTSCYFLL